MSLQKQYEYNDQYQKENILRVVVKFNKKNERDCKIYEHLKSQPSTQEYIKRVVESDMKK